VALRVEPLSSGHNRVSFSCGESALDDYLRTTASQDARRHIASVFVAIDTDSGRVAGYYTTSGTSFARDDLPEKERKRLPRYPVPAALIGRFAVDETHQGKGIGRFLLFDALTRVVRASTDVAAWGVVVDAKSERAAQFYEKYGFRRFPNQPFRLFIPLATVEAALPR